MGGVLVLPVPEALPALYLVPGSMPHEDAERMTDAAVARYVAAPLSHLTRDLIGTPGLALAVRPLSDFAALDGPSGDGDVVAFASRIEPCPGPVHEWVTRAAAASFAAELDVPLLDGFAGTAIDPVGALATLPGSPGLATVAGGFRLADWVSVRPDGRRLSTCGMRRFELPELTVDDIPPQLETTWTKVLLAIGARAHEHLRCELRRGEATAFLEIPAGLGIGRRDIGAAYGLVLDDAGQQLPVRLSLEPVIGSVLGSVLIVDVLAEHKYSARSILATNSIPAANGIPAADGIPATGGGPRARRNPHPAAARRRASARRSQRQT